MYGSGRLFMQSPSDSDLMLLQERDDETAEEKEHPCGRGGGVNFVGQLMKAQGLEREFGFIEEKLAKDQTSATVEWWCSYDKPEDVGYFGT
jgi:hypothetical protein